MSSSSDEVSSTETHAALSVVDNSIPSTFKQQKTGESNYFHQSEAMNVILKTPMKILISDSFTKVRPHPIVPSIASLTSSSTSSSSSNSSKSNSSLDTEDDSEQVDPQNVTVAGTNSQKPEEREERSRKRIRKPAKWKSKVAKVLRDSHKVYQSFSKSKKQVPQRKVGPLSLINFYSIINNKY
ncbi:hypothetical protein HNY73_015135 [Argiope bruennichi]|uniref:Uncharacterized protein n=1 Tax=Argiope bruennichi TaxID=94029 RepID=A0A8T0ESP4_ARGBR|nr:hypothetical protein HNY73_015135 [Argiope bruennichi]